LIVWLSILDNVTRQRSSATSFNVPTEMMLLGGHYVGRAWSLRSILGLSETKAKPTVTGSHRRPKKQIVNH